MIIMKVVMDLSLLEKSCTARVSQQPPPSLLHHIQDKPGISRRLLVVDVPDTTALRVSTVNQR